MNIVCIVKANNPPALNMNENTIPTIGHFSIVVTPKIIAKSNGMCISKNPVIPPRILNSSHSFQ